MILMALVNAVETILQDLYFLTRKGPLARIQVLQNTLAKPLLLGSRKKLYCYRKIPKGMAFSLMVLTISMVCL